MQRWRKAWKYGSSTRASASAFSSASVTTSRGSPITRFARKQATRTRISRTAWLPSGLGRRQQDDPGLVRQAGPGDLEPWLHGQVGDGELLAEAVDRLHLRARRPVQHR